MRLAPRLGCAPESRGAPTSAERQNMTTTPQEPGSDPDVTPGGDPLEPNPPSPTEPDETEHPE